MGKGNIYAWCVCGGIYHFDSTCVTAIISKFVCTFTRRNFGVFSGSAIVGIGQGIALPAGPTHICEVPLAESRGKIMSFG
jgi:hypothetical protein